MTKIDSPPVLEYKIGPLELNYSIYIVPVVYIQYNTTTVVGTCR